MCFIFILFVRDHRVGEGWGGRPISAEELKPAALSQSCSVKVEFLLTVSSVSDRGSQRCIGGGVSVTAGYAGYAVLLVRGCGVGAQDGNKKRGCKQEQEKKRLRYRRRVTDAKKN